MLWCKRDRPPSTRQMHSLLSARTRRARRLSSGAAGHADLPRDAARPAPPNRNRHPPSEAPMRFIPTRVHGMMDYLMGVVLIAAPFVLSFDTARAETWVPIVLGVGVIGYS